MVEIEKNKTHSGYNIKINIDDRIFNISYEGNGDLYFNTKRFNKSYDEVEEKTFLITKENYFIYSLFYKLFEDIEAFNVFGDEEFNKEYRDTHKEPQIKLFRKGKIEYHSDDAPFDIASVLFVEKLDEEFKLTFKSGRVEYLPKTFSVRICNSGSRYHPFNIIFMRLYNEFCEYDPDVHQIHMEEYLYEQKLARKKDINV